MARSFRRRVISEPSPVPRLTKSVLALAVVAMLFWQVRDPSLWNWVTALEQPARAEANVPAAPVAADEPVVPGPDDRDQEAWARMDDLLGGIADRKPLSARDMPAYWQLMAWSRAQSTHDLAQRAQSNVLFKEFWEQPDQYRAKPVRMRLHVRRVLEYDAPTNPIGVTKVYEVWGPTDESQSFPYVVVLPNRPEGLPIGAKVQAELDFSGYFLKIMSYEAAENKRGAPLFIGRGIVDTKAVVSLAARRQSDASSIWLVAGAIVVGLLVVMFIIPRGRRRPLSSLAMAPTLDQLPVFAETTFDPATESAIPVNFDHFGQPPAGRNEMPGASG